MALVRLSQAECVRLGRVRISGPSILAVGAPFPGLGGPPPLFYTLCETHAAALGALLRASAAAGTLRDVTLQRVLLPVQSLAALADALEVSAVSLAATRLAFNGCLLDLPTQDVQIAALSRLLRAAGGVAAAAADSCLPGSAWAEAFGAALEGGAGGEGGTPFAPATLSFHALSANAAGLEALSRGLVACAPSLRRLALCCAWAMPPQGVAALAAVLPQLRALTWLDVDSVLPARMRDTGGVLEHALGSHNAVLSAPRAAAAADARSVLDVRGFDEAAVGAALSRKISGLAFADALTTLLVGGSCLHRHTAALLFDESRMPLHQLTSLHVTHSRFDAQDVRTVLSARHLLYTLHALTLVTERPLSASVLLDVGIALTPPPKGVPTWLSCGRLSGLASFRLHAAAFRQSSMRELETAQRAWQHMQAQTVRTGKEEAEEAGGSAADAATTTAEERACAPSPLTLLQLSADAPCAEVLALRHAPHGAHVQLRLLRRDTDFSYADELICS